MLLLIIYVFIDYLPSFHFGDFACLEFFQCASWSNKRAGKIEYQKHCVWNYTNNMERHKRARYMLNSWQERRYHSFLWRGDFKKISVSEWVIERLIDRVSEWVSEWVNGWEIVWVCECVRVWVCECVSVWVCECVSVWVSVWVCECVSVWVCECMSVCMCEWVSEWVSKSVCVCVLVSEWVSERARRRKREMVENRQRNHY